MRCQSYKAQTLNAYYSIIKCNKLSPEDDHIISSQNVVKKKINSWNKRRDQNQVTLPKRKFTTQMPSICSMTDLLIPEEEVFPPVYYEDN